MERYCICIAVISADARNSLSQLIAGLFGKTVARWPDAEGQLVVTTQPPDGTEPTYVLAQNGTPVLINNEPVIVMGMIGVNQNVPQNVQNELTQLHSRTGGRVQQMSFNPSLASHQEIFDRLRQEAGSMGASKVWQTKSGDSTTIANSTQLLAKFVPVIG